MRTPDRQPAARALPGFTLVEVLVSLFILVIGTVAATTLVSHLLRSTATTEEELVATNLAHSSQNPFTQAQQTYLVATCG